MVPAFGSGWEVSRICVERLGELMNNLPRENGKTPSTDRRRASIRSMGE
jgi:hypothetical protein